MEDDDAGLRQLLALDDAPGRDFDFELAVAAKIARRRLRRAAIDWLLMGLAAAVTLWAAGPWLAAAARAVGSALDGSAPFVFTAAAVALALVITWRLPAAFDLAPPGDY
jgi:hypothetical protein